MMGVVSHVLRSFVVVVDAVDATEVGVAADGMGGVSPAVDGVGGDDISSKCSSSVFFIY